MKPLIKTAIAFLHLIYAILKIFPAKKKIVFLSRQANAPSLDFQMLSERILQMHPDYRTVMLCRMLQKTPKGMAGYCFHMLRQMYHLATSRAAILDSYCIPISLLKHKKTLLVIQMWHSVGTMKKFGYSILDQPEGSSSEIAHLMKMHHGYDYVLAAGEGYKDHLAEGFCFDRSRILTYPLPRLELLQDPAYISDCRRKITAAYPVIQQKKNLVYVPTFRKGEDAAFRQALNDLIEAIDLTAYNLIVKAHPLAEFNSSDPRIICDTEYSSMEMLCVANAVISDYSCIIYEAAVLKKPLYFYTYDYAQYMSKRDIYIDYKKEMPGPICDTATELAQALSAKYYDYVKLEQFLNRYVEVTGNETENIVNLIFDHIS
ncbi:MAG: polyribitolphosphotransferase [Lachnospiraceae bacterium]|nr:polyribitolphosphotransferase [Lachnospiraceae bacterium]